MAKPIIKLTDAQCRRLAKNKRARVTDVITLPNGQKYLVAAMALTADAVPADYADLKAHVESHSKITLFRDIANGQADTVEAGYQTDLHITVHEREDEATE